MKVTVMKDNNKWTIYTLNGEKVFTGKTRVSCFRYIMEQGWKLIEYQHGGIIANRYDGYRSID